jgi:hypothetical protein
MSLPTRFGLAAFDASAAPFGISPCDQRRPPLTAGCIEALRRMAGSAPGAFGASIFQLMLIFYFARQRRLSSILDCRSEINGRSKLKMGGIHAGRE